MLENNIIIPGYAKPGARIISISSSFIFSNIFCILSSVVFMESQNWCVKCTDVGEQACKAHLAVSGDNNPITFKAYLRNQIGHLKTYWLVSRDWSSISPSHSLKAFFPLSAKIWENHWSIALSRSGGWKWTIWCPAISSLLSASDKALLHPGTTGKNLSSSYLKKTFLKFETRNILACWNKRLLAILI